MLTDTVILQMSKSLKASHASHFHVAYYLNTLKDLSICIFSYNKLLVQGFKPIQNLFDGFGSLLNHERNRRSSLGQIIKPKPHFGVWASPVQVQTEVQNRTFTSLCLRDAFLHAFNAQWATRFLCPAIPTCTTLLQSA